MRVLGGKWLCEHAETMRVSNEENLIQLSRIERCFCFVFGGEEILGWHKEWIEQKSVIIVISRIK
jgi:hypothetical protein